MNNDDLRIHGSLGRSMMCIFIQRFGWLANLWIRDSDMAKLKKDITFVDIFSQTVIEALWKSLCWWWVCKSINLQCWRCSVLGSKDHLIARCRQNGSGIPFVVFSKFKPSWSRKPTSKWQKVWIWKINFENSSLASVN